MKITLDYLTPNKWSRPRLAIGEIKGICLHWVGNPLTGAKFNRDFFELRKNGRYGYGSAHYIVGIEGEVVECIPTHEIAYHAGPTTDTKKEAAIYYGEVPNKHLIGVETCHLDWDGNYTEETWQSMIALCAKLLRRYGLPGTAITTHNYITGKLCPKLFVTHPEKLEEFKLLVDVKKNFWIE